MKILAAFDSFKGSLRAPAVAAAFASGWKQVRPGDQVIEMPLSDGGEGMCEAVVRAKKGDMLRIAAHDPLMRPRTAAAGVCGNCAVLESAEANGIELLAPCELDPLAATTFGVGEMMKELLTCRHCRSLLVGIGGSATVDGGIGMLQALGAVFYTESGEKLPDGAGGGALGRVARADLSGLLPALKQAEVRVACDVGNPLTGPRGAARVFGPQKGATPEMVESLDRDLAHFARILGDTGDRPGDGAAGGLGFALRHVLHAQMVSGAALVMRTCGFETEIENCSLVVTGEGCSDDQTLDGKLCSVVAATAAEHGVPTLLCSGALRGSCRELSKHFAGCFSIAPGPGTLEQAMNCTAANLERCGAEFARLISRFSPGDAAAVKERDEFA